MTLVPYPSALPVEAVSDIIRIVKASSYLEEKEVFCASAWNVTGYVLSVAVGELPQGEPPEQLVELRTVCSDALGADAVEPQAMPIWVTLLIEIILRILDDLFDKPEE